LYATIELVINSQGKRGQRKNPICNLTTSKFGKKIRKKMTMTQT
jgi:hypothetical protein